MWENEWGGKIYASYGESNACGVAIAINPKSKVKITKVLDDNRGRLLCAKLQMENIAYTLCNIYAPNCDEPKFYEDCIRRVESYTDCEQKIIGGDFNLVMDPKYDRNNSTSNLPKAYSVITEYMDKANICDIWCIRNPATRRYTWHRWGSLHHPICS